MTGTPVKDVAPSDRDALATALADNSRTIDCSQFNEMLLVVNKDRVELPFFRHFFARSLDDSVVHECAVGRLANCVEQFQEAAMLQFGQLHIRLSPTLKVHFLRRAT